MYIPRSGVLYGSKIDLLFYGGEYVQGVSEPKKNVLYVK
jgi:hypothetical protein